MNSIIHALNIGTLATWLSVTAFGMVAVLVPGFQVAVVVPVQEEIERIPEDFTLGDLGDAAEEVAAEPVERNVQSEALPRLPAPPELEVLADVSPLPEIPEIPVLAEKPVAFPVPAVRQELPARSEKRASAERRPPARSVVSAVGAAAAGGSSAAADASRLARGRMPAPIYPAAARRGGQTGTVLVEFTVDSSGRVISAYAKSPSPWPLLNAEAVRTVRKWRFPAGGLMKLQRPIVFQLR